MLLLACAGPDKTPADSPALETAETADTAHTGVDSESGLDSVDTTDTGETAKETAAETDTQPPCPELSVTTAKVEFSGALALQLTTPVPTTSTLTWGYEGDEYTPHAVEDPTTTHDYLLVGPAPDTTVAWRIDALLHGQACSVEGTWTRPADESPRPDFRLQTAKEGFQSGWRLVPVAGSPPNVVIFDDAGNIVWNWRPPGGYAPVQARFDVAEHAVVVLLEIDDKIGNFSLITRVSLDQGTEESWQAPDAHHGFAQLDDGSFVYLATDTRGYDGYDVSGDAMVHVALDNTRTTLWSTWDEWTPDIARIQNAGSDYYWQSLDWTHANSVNVRADGSYLVSFHAIDAVATIEAAGGLRWVLSGQDPGVPSSFAWTGTEDELFRWQHSAVETAGGLALFDNGSGIKGAWSEAAVLALDEGAFTAGRTWSYGFDGATRVDINGAVHELPNGEWLVSWGSEGFLTQTTPDGTLTWHLDGASDEHAAVLGFTDFAEHLGGAAR